mgnify:CR=1 FL=1
MFDRKGSEIVLSAFEVYLREANFLPNVGAKANRYRD